MSAYEGNICWNSIYLFLFGALLDWDLFFFHFLHELLDSLTDGELERLVDAIKLVAGLWDANLLCSYGVGWIGFCLGLRGERLIQAVWLWNVAMIEGLESLAVSIDSPDPVSLSCFFDGFTVCVVVLVEMNQWQGQGVPLNPVNVEVTEWVSTLNCKCFLYKAHALGHFIVRKVGVILHPVCSPGFDAISGG